MGANEPRETAPLPETASPPTEHDKPARARDALSRGTLLGRYIIIDELGAGGMGVVYVAYDPELNRRVAVKVLKAQYDANRLLREAQALARLAHPNVVAVYDVGSHDDRIFVAMELVEGETLAAHLREGVHDWPEVLALFIQAGRGLVAAHEAGVVHRDFKPGNVLVGKDERVRVLDFGLARAGSAVVERTSDSPHSGRDALGEELTQTGSILGTPLYMPPEAFRGDITDELGDQFSFCAALYQGLYRQTPFDIERDGKDPARWVVREPPRDTAVPRWLRDVVWRGLASAPKERHPDMRSMLALLDRRPALSRRGLVVLGAIAAISIAGVGYAAVTRREAAVCRVPDHALARIWDPATKAVVRQRFIASGSPFANEAWTSTERLLDAYTRRWIAIRSDVCEATRVRRDQTEAVMTLRMSCLDQRLQELDALVGVFHEPDAAMVLRAPTAARALGGLDRCSDVASLTAAVPPPADPFKRQKLDALRVIYKRFIALTWAGKWDDALGLGNQLSAQAKALGYRPLESDVLRNIAKLQNYKALNKEAIQTARTALEAAEAGRDDFAKAQVASELVTMATDLGDYELGLEWARFAEAVLEHHHDVTSRIDLLINLGGLYAQKYDFPMCESSLREAIRLQARIDPNDMNIMPAHVNLAHCLILEGKLAEGSGHLETATRLLDRDFPSGRHHVAGIIAFNLGAVENSRGNFPQAITHFAKAAAIAEAKDGKSHPDAMAARMMIARQHSDMGDPDKALALLEPELAAFNTRTDSDVMLGSVLTHVAQVKARRGDFAGAELAAKRMFEIDRRLLGSEDKIPDEDWVLLGEIYFGRGRLKEALAMFERADAAEQAQGPSALRCRVLGMLGSTLLALHDARALGVLEAAAKAADGEAVQPYDRGQARFALAQQVTDLSRARSLAEQARRDFAAAFARGAKRLPAVDTWLARHR